MKAIRFHALLKPTLWGGDDVSAIKHLPDSPSHIGESWEISAVPGNETTVRDGEYQGLTLRQLIDRCGESLMGRRNLDKYGHEFPLLVKFLSTASDLSIQVHPDDRMAQAMGHPYGKSEMQYIVHTAPEAVFYAGFNAPFSADGYTRSIADGTLMAHLQRYTTHAGDCFFIPAGHIHSIGAGNFLIEVQQSSDDTFRAFDFDRVDAQGRKRELHVQQAREALCFDSDMEHRLPYDYCQDGCTRLVKCPEFEVCLYDLTRPYTLSVAALDSFVILVAYAGCARLVYDEGEEQLSAGETILFPANTRDIEIIPETEAFRCLETHC